MLSAPQIITDRKLDSGRIIELLSARGRGLSDVALYGLVPEGVSFLVRAGQFALLFPEDGHIPSCAWDQPAEVFKSVVKIAV